MNAQQGKKTYRNPLSWVPSLYYAEGIPYAIVITLSVIMYKRLGISNTDIALYTSWLYLPWTIKPFWSPLVEMFRTKRFWIVAMQLLIGAGLAGIGMTIPVPGFFKYTLIFFWLLAFSSATHDIAADGFYMLGLTQSDQAFYVGIRNTFYRFAMLTGQGLIVILAGYLESATGLEPAKAEVHAIPGKSEYVVSSPVEVEDKNALHIQFNGNIEIGTKNISKEKADSIKNTSRASNVANGFYITETKQRKQRIDGHEMKEDESAGWLENFIRKHFGVEKPPVPDDYAGSIGLLKFQLSEKPENEEVVVNLGQEAGDKSINLIEGTRFVFTDENWNKEAIAVIQLDPKLDEKSNAVYVARSGNIPLAWSISFFILAALFGSFFIYHKIVLPYPVKDVKKQQEGSVFGEFIETFIDFFRKKNIGIALAFLLLFRLGEAQLVKLASPFLLDAREAGGLGLTTGDIGLVYGTIGVVALILGGIIGGIVVSRKGLKFWIWWMLLFMNLPNLVYVYLSYTLPDSFWIVAASVAVEQFGYGFGFTAYMLYLIYIADGKYQTAHYAIGTGFMALGMMIPGMFSGWLQEIIGYQHFFIWVVICTIPIFILTKFLHIDPKFGVKDKKH